MANLPRRLPSLGALLHCAAPVASMLMLLLFCLATIRPAAAQEAAPTGDPALSWEFQRGLQREAPSRQPRVVQRETRASGAVNTILELPAVADAYIASGRPNQNFGADSLFLGYNSVGDSFGAERLLVRFDIANNIPPNADVHSARLRLNLAFSSPSQDAAMGAVLRRVASHWNEGDVTWNREPAWTDIDAARDVGSAPGWYEWDVTALVAGWVDGAFSNHGMEIIGDERIQQRERAFYSRETNTEFFPRLVVDFTVIQDNEPPAVSVEPLPAFSGRNFAVAWGGTDPGGAGIDCYDVQYRIDGGDWVDWHSCVTFSEAEFPDGQNGRLVEFRARGRDNAGNVESYGGAEASTRVDTQPPVSTIEPLPGILSVRQFTVRWTGNDRGGSGVQYYDVRYRYNNGDWLPWQQQTVARDALFVAPADGVYEFEVRGVDHRGMVEDFRGQPEAGVVVDAEAPFLARLYFPFAGRAVVVSD